MPNLKLVQNSDSRLGCCVNRFDRDVLAVLYTYTVRMVCTDQRINATTTQISEMGQRPTTTLVQSDRQSSTAK